MQETSNRATKRRDTSSQVPEESSGRRHECVPPSSCDIVCCSHCFLSDAAAAHTPHTLLIHSAHSLRRVHTFTGSRLGSCRSQCGRAGTGSGACGIFGFQMGQDACQNMQVQTGLSRENLSRVSHIVSIETKYLHWTNSRDDETDAADVFCFQQIKYCSMTMTVSKYQYQYQY